MILWVNLLKRLSDFFNEMATNSGINDPSNYSGENDWNNYYKNSSNKKPIKNKFGSDHLKLYLVRNSNWYLTYEDDTYAGYIQLEHIKDKIYKINQSNSNLKRGFYNVMFMTILSTDIVTEIISDDSLSEQAINSYARITVNGYLNVQVYDYTNNLYYPFSKELLLSNKFYRVSVTEKQKNTISEHFTEYYRRINKTEILENGFVVKLGLTTAYENKQSVINNYLFCEDYNLSDEDYRDLIRKVYSNNEDKTQQVINEYNNLINGIV